MAEGSTRDDQRDITEFLHKQKAEFDKLIKQAQRETNLLLKKQLFEQAEKIDINLARDYCREKLNITDESQINEVVADMKQSILPMDNTGQKLVDQKNYRFAKFDENTQQYIPEDKTKERIESADNSIMLTKQLLNNALEIPDVLNKYNNTKRNSFSAESWSEFSMFGRHIFRDSKRDMQIHAIQVILNRIYNNNEFGPEQKAYLVIELCNAVDKQLINKGPKDKSRLREVMNNIKNGIETNEHYKLLKPETKEVSGYMVKTHDPLPNLSDYLAKIDIKFTGNKEAQQAQQEVLSSLKEFKGSQASADRPRRT